MDWLYELHAKDPWAPTLLALMAVSAASLLIALLGAIATRQNKRKK